MSEQNIFLFTFLTDISVFTIPHIKHTLSPNVTTDICALYVPLYNIHKNFYINICIIFCRSAVLPNELAGVNTSDNISKINKPSQDTNL